MIPAGDFFWRYTTIFSNAASGVKQMLKSGRSLTAWCVVSVGLWAILAGCACNRATDSDGVKVEVANVGVDQDGAPYVMLEDSAAGRSLPIAIGESEAQSIALELHGLNPGRPLTYDLIRNILDSTGNHVDRVEVNELRDQTYFAIILLDHGRHSVDSRPSDAIAVALATKAPIYVSARLFDSGAMDVEAPDHTPPAVHGLGLTVQELSPDIAKYFTAKPDTALLVADVSVEAARAGVVRGDLLTAIGAGQIRNLTDFDHNLARLGRGQTVAVTLERDGHVRTVTLRASQ
jgi:bifunctional DNase/RNase